MGNFAPHQIKHTAIGVIQRQGLKRSVVTYSAAVIGALSAYFIFPLDYERYGEIRFLLSVVAILFPLASWGALSLPVRFFPDFETGDRQRGFLGVLLLWLSFSFGVTLLLLLWNAEPLYAFLDWLGFDVEMFRKNARPLIFLVLLASLIELLKKYTSNFKRVVVPEILATASLKIFIPTLILTGLFWPESFGSVSWALVYFHLVITLGLGLYLFFLGGFNLRPDWAFLNRPRVMSMANFAAYGMIGSLGSVIAFNLDSIMVGGMVGLVENGQYTNALNFATFVAIPQTAISAIAGPIISRAIQKNDWATVEDLYQQSSLNLGFVGVCIYGLLLINIETLAQLSPSPEKFTPLIIPIIVLGLAKVIDMLSGLNREIMGYSDLYRLNMGLVLLLAAVNILTNYLLIPRYGILGAAFATTLSISCVNLLRGIVLYAKKGIQPLTIAHLQAIGFVALVATPLYFINTSSLILVTAAAKSLLFAAAIFGANHYFGWSRIIDEKLVDVVKKLRGKA